MRIGLFATCLGDVLFPDVPRATTALLERLGHEVVFPADQTCCGQMHTNTGYQRDAVGLVRHHVEVFERALAGGVEAVDAIVAPSGSCVGSVRHQHAELARRAGDDALAERAEAVASRTFELSELLVDVLGVTDVTFAVKNADTSTAMLADKMAAVRQTRAEVLTAGDASCLMHIGGGLARLRTGVRPVHLAQVLASTQDAPWEVGA